MSSPTIVIEVNKEFPMQRKHSLQAINKYKRDKLMHKSASQKHHNYSEEDIKATYIDSIGKLN